MKHRQLLNQFLINPRIKRLAVLIFFNAAGFGISNGVIKLFFFPFLSRILGEEGFGNFLVGFSFASVLTVIPSAAITNSMMRDHASYQGESRANFFKTFAIITFIIGPFTSVIYLLLVWSLSGFFANTNIRVCQGTLALYTCFYFIFATFGSILGCGRKYISKSVFEIISGLLFIVVVPVLWFINVNLTTLSLFLVYAIVVGFQILVLREIFQGAMRLEPSVLKLIWTTSPFYMGATIMDVFIQYGNRWLLAYFLDAKAVSAYYVGLSTVMLFGLMISVFAQLETLIVSQREKVADLRWSDIKLVLFGLTAFSFILTLLAWMFSEPIMIRLYGHDLAEKGMSIFYILLATLFFSLPMYMLRPFVIKYCRPSLSMIFSVSTAIVSIILGLILVPRAGIRGGAIAMLISVVLLSFMYILQFVRRIMIPVYCNRGILRLADKGNKS